MIGKTIVRQYDTKGHHELLYHVTVEQADGLQPLLVTAVMGQGDIPGPYQDAFANSSASSNKARLIASGVAFVISLAWLTRWLKRRREA